MKRNSKLLILVIAIVMLAALSVGFTACNNDGDTLRFSAPQGTPALAMLRLSSDNAKIGGKEMEYEVVNPDNIASEMSSGKSDVVIMPVNAGAKLIKQGKDYKLVSVAVEGSLFMIGKKDGSNTLTVDDIKGKKIACIGQTGVPGLIFRYVMANNGIEVILSGTPNENQVLVSYVSAANNAMSELSSGKVDFAVMGEPAVTQAKIKLSLNAEMNMQTEYSRVNPETNGSNYPQAGLFVRSSLASDKTFMDALFKALEDSKNWVVNNPTEVEEFAKQNLYAAAMFPSASLERCAIKCERLDDGAKAEIIAFLNNVMPKDADLNDIDWESAKDMIFG